MNTFKARSGKRRRLPADAVRVGFNYLTAVYGGDRVPPPAPAALLIGITNKCNLRCDFCFHAGNDIPTGLRRPKGLMTEERFAAIIDQARGWCTHLHFGLFGEPTLHPRFLDFVRLAVEAQLTVAVFTNGTLLDAERARELVEIGPASVTFSLEGHTPEEYTRLRVGSRWDGVMDNLRGLVAAKRAAGRRCPVIVARGIALESLAGQRRAHADYYRAMGVDQVMWMPAANWSGSLRGPQGSVPASVPPERTQRCTFPSLQLGIDWDGTAVPCCADFNAKNALGNVDVTSLRDLWNGAELAGLRRSLATCSRDHIDATTGCAGCSSLSQPALSLEKKLQLVQMAIGEFGAQFADG